MKIKNKLRASKGFSVFELLFSMTIMLVCLAMVSTLLSRSFGVRARESQKTDALASAQGALNVISRELANSGFGIYTGTSNKNSSNGLIVADSNANRVHFRCNVQNVGTVGGNTVLSTNLPGEDITYFYESTTNSIVRYDPNDNPTTSVVVNRISNVTFEYFDYVGTSSVGVATVAPTANTGRVKITVQVQLDAVQGQPSPLDVTFTSEVTLRNSKYMLNQY